MNKNAAQTLRAIQSKNRTMLLVSMVFFLAALFALVSRWPSCYVLIVLSCLFYLFVSRNNKKRYKRAFVQALMVEAVEPDAQAERFCDTEPADGLLSEKGLLPAVALVPGAKQHHVLHGSLNDHAFSIGEAAFVRKSDAVRSVAGTLLSVEGVLPQDEQWLLCEDEPIPALCRAAEYEKAGYVRTDDAWTHTGSTCESLPVYAESFRKEKKPGGTVLAARNTSLTLFMPGVFFAPEKLDIYKTFSPSTLKGVRLLAFDMMEHFLRAANAQ